MPRGYHPTFRLKAEPRTSVQSGVAHRLQDGRLRRAVDSPVMRTAAIALPASWSWRSSPARAAGAVPHAQRQFRPAALHRRRGVEARARRTCASTSWCRPGCCRCPSARRSAGGLRRGRARRLHRVEGLLREPAGLLRHRQPLSARSAPGRFPAILAPHGHWAYGRLENTALNSVPGRAISLARQGFVVFTHDMVGYDDSRQLPHTFGGRRESLWGLSLGRPAALERDPRARFPRVAALRPPRRARRDRRIRRRHADVPARRRGRSRRGRGPVNMISLHMQGGCLCENMPGLRLDTNNVEIAATIAPRPLLMVSATGDWTANTMEREYPAVRGALCAARRAGPRARGAIHGRAQLQQGVARSDVCLDGALDAEGAPADVQARERSFTRRLAGRPAGVPSAAAAARGAVTRRRS